MGCDIRSSLFRDKLDKRAVSYAKRKREPKVLKRVVDVDKCERLVENVVPSSFGITATDGEESDFERRVRLGK